MPYRCTDCGHTENERGDLRAHIRKDHGVPASDERQEEMIEQVDESE